MTLDRSFVFSIFACACIAAPLLAQEAVETPSSAETVEPPALEQKAAEKTPRPPPKEKEEKTTRDVQDSMTADEFKAAGLNKLSPQELKSLNAWLQGYRRTAETKAAEKATAATTEKMSKVARARVDLIESSLKEQFNGLAGRTIITLEDGTAWKQANPEDHFRASVAEHTDVLMTHGAFGWRMQIKGSRSFYVDPIRK